MSAAALALGTCGAPQPTVLLSASGSGNASETLTSTSSQGWDMHWSYNCPDSHGVFVIDVYNSDRTPDFAHPGVDEQGDKDSGVYKVPGAGRFYLEITTTCKWTVKVTASP